MALPQLVVGMAVVALLAVLVVLAAGVAALLPRSKLGVLALLGKASMAVMVKQALIATQVAAAAHLLLVVAPQGRQVVLEALEFL